MGSFSTSPFLKRSHFFDSLLSALIVTWASTVRFADIRDLVWKNWCFTHCVLSWVYRDSFQTSEVPTLEFFAPFCSLPGWDLGVTAVNKKSLTHFHKCANLQWSWVYLKDELLCLFKPNTKIKQFLECHTDSNKHQGIVQYYFYISTVLNMNLSTFFIIDPCISVHFVLFPPLPSALHLSIPNENSYIFSYKTCRVDCGYY